MISLTIAISVLPGVVRADSTQTDKSGSQKLGKQMGSFMNSFMEGLDSQEGGQKGIDTSAQQREQGLRQNRRPNSPSDNYDPWGARPDRYNNSNRPFSYDPWGATRESGDLTRFADQDWALGEQYYGLGGEPQGGRRGYRRGPYPYLDRGNPSWNRNNEHTWPGSSYEYPYGGNRYNGSEW